VSTNQINGFLFFFSFCFFHWVCVRCCCWWRQLPKLNRTTGKLTILAITDTPTSPDGLTNRPTEVLSYDQKVSLLGRPKLGENTRLQIRVKESKEFKVFILYAHLLISKGKGKEMRNQDN
jgi:hypothetical protein